MSAFKLLARISEWRNRMRFRVWVLRSRLRLARHGCHLEVVAPHGARFATPPTVLPTLQLLEAEPSQRRGSLRIELGEYVYLGEHLNIEVLPSADSVLVLDDGVVLGTAVRLIMFGGEVRIGAWGRLRDGATIKSSGRLQIGEHLILQSWCMVQCAEEIVLEDRVAIAERVTIIDSDHLADGSDTYSQSQPLAVAPVHIARNVWLGANAIVLRGARLAPNSVVAAGSVVRGGDYPSGWLVAGVPAKSIKPLSAVADRAS